MITIRNVSHTIGSNPILNDVSLDIPEGGITALIGPNGAGKSTLLSFMARLQPLVHGDISYAGKDIKTTPTAELARTLSILTQENSIMSRITVRDLLMFGRYPYHQGRPSETDADKRNTLCVRSMRKSVWIIYVKIIVFSKSCTAINCWL